MGAAAHMTIRSMRRLLLKHKCAILCRNMAESSILTGDVLFSAVRTEERRRRKIDRLKEEKFSLEREVKELKFELDSTFEISSQVKADVDMGEKRRGQTLEEKVKELQAALEKEKERREEAEENVKKMDSKMESSRKVKAMLDNELRAKTQKNKELKAQLNTARLSLSQ
ncbi:hypothetical protein Dimus_010728, partial [Dionaea muscipula]